MGRFPLLPPFSCFSIHANGDGTSFHYHFMFITLNAMTHTEDVDVYQRFTATELLVAMAPQE